MWDTKSTICLCNFPYFQWFLQNRFYADWCVCIAGRKLTFILLTAHYKEEYPSFPIWPKPNQYGQQQETVAFLHRKIISTPNIWLFTIVVKRTNMSHISESLWKVTRAAWHISSWSIISDVSEFTSLYLTLFAKTAFQQDKVKFEVLLSWSTYPPIKIHTQKWTVKDIWKVRRSSGFRLCVPLYWISNEQWHLSLCCWLDASGNWTIVRHWRIGRCACRERELKGKSEEFRILIRTLNAVTDREN